jgi:hypothetical protein
MRARPAKYTPIFDEAIAKAQGAGNRFDSNWRDYYMNPYTDSVLDGVNRRYNDETDRQLQAIRAKQVSQGALYGPDVMRNLINPYIEQRSLSQGDINNQILSEAYDKSYNMFSGDEDRALKAAGVLGTEAQRGYNAAGTDIDTQFNYGEKQRALEQALKDLQYEEFQNEFYYPQMQSDWYRQLLAGVPTDTTQETNSKSGSKTTGTGMMSSSLGAGDIGSGVMGGLLGGAGVAGQLGWSPFSGGAGGGGGGMGLSFLSDLMSSSGGNTISGGGSTFMM